jgi:F-type H+-transporting ATPase subunit delta
MADVQVGRRYAQAAFAIAKDGNTVALWRAELDDVATVLAESQLAPLLADSRLPAERRMEMAARALSVSPLVLNLAKLLIAKGRSLDARAVSNAFNTMADEHEGVAHAEVTTAVELAPDQLNAIAARLTTAMGKNVRATSVVDPGIIGGVVVKVGDRLVDGSIRTRLRRLRRELEGAR